MTTPPADPRGVEVAPLSVGYLRAVAIAVLVGVPAAFAAAVFLALVHLLDHWLWITLPDHLGETSPPWYLVLAVPVVGAAIVLAARRLLPGDGGNPPLVGLSERPTPVRYVPGVIIAAVGSLTFGAVLGPEAPVIAIGSAVGVAATSLVRTNEREAGMLATAGSFSAISALFGGPIVAAVMLVEAGVGAGSALIPGLLPGFVAAAIGYVIFIGFGHWGGLNTPGLAVPNLPAYHGTHLWELGIAVLVGAIAALMVRAVRGLASALADLGARHVPVSVFLLTGGVSIGALAALADGLGANSQDVLFSGQASIPALVVDGSTKIVIILLVGKALGYIVSLACGYRGGPIFPAVFLGIALAALPVVWLHMSPTVAVAMGAAAGMAAQSGLLTTSALFGALLVGGQGIDATPAAVLAATTAWLTVRIADSRHQ